MGQWWRLVPGEKLLIGRRRPVRNWNLRTTTSSLFLCRKLHLFLGISTKTAAARAALFDSNMHQIVCRSRVQTPLGAYSAPPDSLAVFRGLTSKGRGEDGRGGKGKGRAEEGDERGEEGSGGREFVLCPRKKKKEKSVPIFRTQRRTQPMVSGR